MASYLKVGGLFYALFYEEPNELSCSYLAERLGVAASWFLRLCNVLGGTPESWLTMQDNHEIWQARKRINLLAVFHHPYQEYTDS